MNQAVNACLAGWNHLGKAFCGSAASAFVQSALLVIAAVYPGPAVAPAGACRLSLLRVAAGAGETGPAAHALAAHGDWLLDRETACRPPLRYRSPSPSPRSISGVETATICGARALRWDSPDPASGPGSRDGCCRLRRRHGHWTSRHLAGHCLAPVAGRVAGVPRSAGAAFAASSRGLVAASTPAGQAICSTCWSSVARQIGVRRPVGLRTLDTLPSPAVCGLRQSRDSDADRAHRESSPRRDFVRPCFTSWLTSREPICGSMSVQTFLQVLYFYNPFVWLANADDPPDVRGGGG